MTNTSASANCPSCDQDIPSAANFCPNCGTKLAAEGATAPSDTLVAPVDFTPAHPDAFPSPAAPPGAFASPPPRIHRVHGLSLGRGAAPVFGGLGLLTLVASILMFAIAASIAGVILLGISLAFSALFLAAIERDPESGIARGAHRALDRTQSLARVIAVAVQAWSRASLELVSNRGRRHRLHNEFQERLKPLGEAVYNGDQTRATRLKEQAGDFDRSLREAERAASEILSSVREEIEREWATAQPTQAIPALRRGAPADGEREPA